MKHHFIISFLGISLTLAANGCEVRSDSGRKDRKIVVATTTIIADIAQNIAGDRLDVRTIMPIGGDPHIYKPVPGDARLLARADLVLMNGLQLEGWLETLARNAGGHGPIVVVSDGIEPLRDEKRHGDPDPHCWFDVQLVKVFVENIRDAFIKLDSEGEKLYRLNADEYLAQLDTLHRWVIGYITQLPRDRRVLVTSHDAFRYFGAAYDFTVMAVQGINTDAQAQTEDVVRLVRFIREHRVPAVFIETSVNPKLVEQIARETGARIGGLLYSDSIGHPNEEGGTYIGMVRHNVRTIVDALLGKHQESHAHER
jgi:ABC-type Zn uptake system ZnuABC Zn-binding protein ZnuA